MKHTLAHARSATVSFGVTPATLAALVIAVSFAAGLNVYATILTLGAMARLHWVVLPTGLDVLTSWWVLGASTLLFAAEFVADKVPGFDLVWNAAHTFVRIPVALLLAYGATSHLSPQLQVLVTVLGGAIAAITHGSKLAVRGAATTSPEPFSNIALSTSEDILAVGVTWTATHHPIVAGTVAAGAILVAVLMARVAIRAVRRLWRRYTGQATATALVLLLALSLNGTANAQTLARPGWAGSGLTQHSWYAHAVIYEIDTRTFDNLPYTGTLKGVTSRLGYIKSLGVDAILLKSLSAANPSGAAAASPIDPALGTVDDFDELSVQAGRHNLRLLLELQSPEPGLARFWLARGVAGLYLPSAASRHPEAATNIQAIRKLIASYVGPRVLITDSDLSSCPAASRFPSNELVLDSSSLTLPDATDKLQPANFRNALERCQATSQADSFAVALPGKFNRLTAIQTSGCNPPLQPQVQRAEIIATALLLNRSVFVLHAGQEMGMSFRRAAPPRPGRCPVPQSLLLRSNPPSESPLPRIVRRPCHPRRPSRPKPTSRM